MADDDIFDFEKFKKQLDEMKRMQEKYEQDKKEEKRASGQDNFSKMFEMYSSLFKPPSQEEIDKAAEQIAESLEKVAQALREMQSHPSSKKGTEDDETKEGEE